MSFLGDTNLIIFIVMSVASFLLRTTVWAYLINFQLLDQYNSDDFSDKLFLSTLNSLFIVIMLFPLMHLKFHNLHDYFLIRGFSLFRAVITTHRLNFDLKICLHFVCLSFQFHNQQYDNKISKSLVIYENSLVGCACHKKCVFYLLFFLLQMDDWAAVHLVVVLWMLMGIVNFVMPPRLEALFYLIEFAFQRLSCFLGSL